MWAVLLGFLSKYIVADGLKYLALRLLIASAFAVLLPMALYKFYFLVASEMFTWAAAKMNSIGFSFSGVVISFSGVAAWVVIHLRLPEGLAYYLSALLAKETIDLVKYYRLI